MRCFLIICSLVLTTCSNSGAIPALQNIAKFHCIQCSPLIDTSGAWNEIEDLLGDQTLSGKPHLLRVGDALKALSNDEIDSKRLYDTSSVIRMSVCDFPSQYQLTLRKVVNNLMLRAAIEGEKDAIYDIMDTYPEDCELNKISLVTEHNVVNDLTSDVFSKIREELEKSVSDIDAATDAQQLKETLEKAIRRTQSAPSSPVSSPIKTHISQRKTQSDSDLDNE